MNYAQGTALLAGFNLDWGSSVRALFAALKIASGAVTGSVSFGCVMPISYATRAYVSLVGGPLLVARALSPRGAREEGGETGRLLLEHGPRGNGLVDVARARRVTNQP